MERKLRRCPCCGEWFNTTAALMLAHYNAKHRFDYEKAAKVAELVVTREMLGLRAKLAPWPGSQRLWADAAAVSRHLDAVIQRPGQLRFTTNANCVNSISINSAIITAAHSRGRNEPQFIYAEAVR